MTDPVSPGTTTEGRSGAGNAALHTTLVLGQALLVLAIVRAFELENRTVYHVMALALGGFAVHAALPARFRLPFFALLSVASVPIVLGLTAGAIVLALGFLLIGVCHLPVPVWARGALLLALGAALLVLRSSVWGAHAFNAGWTVLGAMFMFRLALYFHSVRHRDARHGAAVTTAYLFMLPNVAFPLFPVVDYNAFVRSHFDSERFRIYNRGIRFMVRGAVQLLLYRWIFFDWALDERYVNNLAQVVQYLTGTFALYLRVSGLFHLVVGIICLYGFRLPETHHLYFLSSNLTDLWRRINIYWKDFMMKLVYYPSFFRLRRHGNRFAMAAATVVVFAGTWALHAYQTQWITGSSQLFARRDMAFWGILGVLVTLSVIWETRPSRKVSKTSRKWSPLRATSTLVTFAVMCVLWSLWNMQSKPAWLFMWSQTRYSTPATWFWLLGLTVCAWALAGFGWGAPTLDLPDREPEPLRVAARKAVPRVLLMGGLLVVASAERALPGPVSDAVHHLKGRGAALLMAAEVQAGYYEELSKPKNVQLAEPWRPVLPTPLWENTSLNALRSDFIVEEPAPSKDSLWMGKHITTNSWGMRDKEYPLAKDSLTYRIAVMGPSFVLGHGVGDGETFEAVLERHMDSLAHNAGRRVEVLNFGAQWYSVAQSVYQMDRKALKFSPDLVMVAVSSFDLRLLKHHLELVQERGIAVPDSALRHLLERAGLGSARGIGELRPFEEEIDVRLFNWARELAAAKGATVVLAAFVMSGGGGRGNLETTFRAARKVGVTVLDCTHVWDGKVAEDFRVGEADAHPNAAGHILLASCLFDQLTQHASELSLNWLPTSGGRR